MTSSSRSAEMKRLLLLSLLLLPPRAAAGAALETVAAVDGAVVRVAADAPNLLEAAAGRIAAFVFAEGQFTHTIDADAGVVYFRPLGFEPRSGFVEIAAADGERRRVALTIVPDAEQVAKRIVLGSPVATPAGLPASAGHVAALKSFLRELLARQGSMAPPPVPAMLTVGEMVLRSRGDWSQHGFVGEIYQLSNEGVVSYELREHELAHGAGVLAIAAQDATVPPQGSTWLYIIREAAASR